MQALSYRLAFLALGITLSILRVIPQEGIGYYPKRVGAISLQHYPAEATEYSPRLATLRLGGGGRLRVSFDLLTAEAKDLYYRISPQTSQGQASELQAFEAFTAFAEEDINDVRQGLMTGLPYVHYTFELSESAWGFKTSGRYLVDVLERGAAGEVLLSIPLYVYEGKILGKLSLSRNAPSRQADKEQYVEAELSLPTQLAGLRPEELWLCVMQNASEDFPQCTLHYASELRPDRWSYRGGRAARFWAGNEYRYIEHLTLRPEGYGIVATGVSPEGWASMRIAEQSDARGEVYQARQDQDGRQILRYRGGDQVATEGEYHIAEFRLRSPLLQGYDILLEGQAFDYIPRKERKLSYNQSEGVYTITYPLKNGYQEYRYVLVPQAEANPSPEPIDGSHYQTQNTYQALVYYRPLGGRHDRLLGIISYEQK